ncbi:MAG: hypothetical protein KTR30_01790 [Saprospiraceae bacterium]|nr:hypothetical protein [Saprospiraceae bacterium]
MERKYDIIFILALALLFIVIIAFDFSQFLEHAMFMLCLISYYIGKFTAKKASTTAS